MTARTDRHLSEWPSWKVVYFKTSFRRESRLGETAEARLRSRWVERDCIEEQELAVDLSSEIWQNDLHHQRMVVKPPENRFHSFSLWHFLFLPRLPLPGSSSHTCSSCSLSLPNDLFPMLSLKSTLVFCVVWLCRLSLGDNHFDQRCIPANDMNSHPLYTMCFEKSELWKLCLWKG